MLNMPHQCKKMQLIEDKKILSLSGLLTISKMENINYSLLTANLLLNRKQKNIRVSTKSIIILKVFIAYFFHCYIFYYANI